MTKQTKSTPSAAGAPAAIEMICKNRRAGFDFAIDERLEAGLVLVGTEVKACRAGEAHLNDAYVQIMRGEAVLVGGHIGEYRQGNRFNHQPERSRKLLLHRNQIDKLYTRLREKGFSAVPVSMYFKGGRVKIEIGVGKGKSSVDRRQDIKSRESQREMQRVIRRGS